MNEFKAGFLKSIIIPFIIIYVLLPRSISYIHESSTLILFSIILFTVLTVTYIFIRTRIVLEYGYTKKAVICDTLIMAIGIVSSCIVCYYGYNYSFWITFIPVCINNHKVLSRNTKD